MTNDQYKFRAWYDNGKGMVYFDDFSEIGEENNYYAYGMACHALA